METKKLFYENVYATKGRGTVLSCEKVEKGWRIELDQTPFYPTGGGQPCDLGRLGNAQVLDVSEKTGRIYHLCGAPLSPGETVEGEIQWERRFSLMQQHSGEHIVSGIIHRRFGFENVGFHMGSDVITIDFSGELDRQQLQEVEEEANGVIWQNLPVTIFYPDEERLSQLHYRSKKALTGAVRLVQFEQIDLCACCGLHVTRTGEIGLIKLLSATRFHSGTRVELLCGQRALAYCNLILEQNRSISAALSAKPTATALAVERMKQERAAAQYRNIALENRLFSMEAAALEGKGDVLLFEEALSSDGLRRLTDAIARVCGGRCAVFAGAEGNYKYAIAADKGDLRELAKALNGACQGRGGGKANFVQGSVAAARKEIEDFFSGI